ncbi:unnamed protein product [Danaus chrysippus]|uniref:(African queen) hypothetical protein n=1 Tax=Danaus chrysippus TaxID=151541 RepID=A0A8J2R5U2_9NEOP|nr:unnamed protein product [Danaus chrysippus]
MAGGEQLMVLTCQYSAEEDFGVAGCMEALGLREVAALSDGHAGRESRVSRETHGPREGRVRSTAAAARMARSLRHRRCRGARRPATNLPHLRYTTHYRLPTYLY